MPDARADLRGANGSGRISSLVIRPRTLVWRERLDDGVGRDALAMLRLRVGVVLDCRPWGENEQEPRVGDSSHAVGFARFEGDQGARLALDRLARNLDHHSAVDNMHDRALANTMIAHFVGAF
jgi:hypothetical protein